MKHTLHLTLIAALLWSIPSLAAAGPLDTYYLQRFGAFNNNAMGAATIQTEVPVERCLTPLYHGLTRDWQNLQQETQKVLAKYLAKPALLGEQTYISTSGHFTIHYATSGADAPPSTAWVQTVADTFEEVYAAEVGQMGYRQAPTTTGTYDIYLQNVGSGLPSAFGFTETVGRAASGSNSFTSYIIIDNDFSSAEFGTQITPYSPLKALQITAAHEYNHAIQYGYNYYFEIWYGEVTATWMEDEVYDGVNQLYMYLPNYLGKIMPLDAPAQSGDNSEYGRWIFNRYLSEKYAQTEIRQIWELLATLSPSNNADIPMLPVIDSALQGKGGGLAIDFFSFVKRIYTRDWLSHQNEINLIHSAMPVQTYASYPVLPITTTTGISPNVTLGHYSYAFYKFTPGSVPPQNLVFNFSQAAGIKITAFRKTSSGQVTEYPQASANAALTIPSFNAPDTTEVMLLICNNSSLDGQAVYFSTDGSQLPAINTSSTVSTSGGKSGCFIATAAYGSYLHPKVALLRQFRDTYLMTNAPGRAFVSCYYRISPPIAAFIAKHQTARILSRIALTPVFFFVEHALLSLLLMIGGTCLAIRYRQQYQR